MTDWGEVDEVFQAARDLGGGAAERTAWLAARCEGRPELHAEVASLLLAYDSSDAFLQPLGVSLAGAGAGAGASAEPVPHAGTRIGPWRLIREIGHGGMGTVFLAERADGAFTQQVRVKITRASVADRDAARRFAAERQIFASINHPHIVTLLDGGTMVTGQAYLVSPPSVRSVESSGAVRRGDRSRESRQPAGEDGRARRSAEALRPPHRDARSARRQRSERHAGESDAKPVLEIAGDWRLHFNQPDAALRDVAPAIAIAEPLAAKNAETAPRQILVRALLVQARALARQRHTARAYADVRRAAMLVDAWPATDKSRKDYLDRVTAARAGLATCGA